MKLFHPFQITDVFYRSLRIQFVNQIISFGMYFWVHSCVFWSVFLKSVGSFNTFCKNKLYYSCTEVNSVWQCLNVKTTVFHILWRRRRSPTSLKREKVWEERRVVRRISQGVRIDVRKVVTSCEIFVIFSFFAPCSSYIFSSLSLSFSFSSFLTFSFFSHFLQHAMWIKRKRRLVENCVLLPSSHTLFLSLSLSYSFFLSFPYFYLSLFAWSAKFIFVCLKCQIYDFNKLLHIKKFKCEFGHFIW